MRDLFPQNSENKPDTPLGQVQQFAQDVQHTLVSESIDATMIGEREIKIEKVGATIKLCTKIDGQVVKVTLA